MTTFFRPYIWRMPLLLAMALLSSDVRAEAPPGVAFFSGRIDEKRVKEFIARYDAGEVKVLEIASQGGLTLPAIELANWVRNRKVIVAVRTVCASACANFVFLAGHRKIIHSPGLVVWHGSAEQKDIREVQKKHELLAEGVLSGRYSTNSPEATFVRDNTKKYEFIRFQRQRQAEFFSELGVDEAICRLGQEPVLYPVEWWTATPAVMQRFGITNVTAPAEYGSTSYIAKNLIAKFLLKGKLMSFGLAAGEIQPLGERGG